MGLCGLVGCGLDAGPPTRVPVLVPPLAGVACWQLGNLRHPGTPGDGKGALATCGLLDMAGPKRACAFWALGSVGHQPGGKRRRQAGRRGGAPMVPGLQGSRSAQAKFPSLSLSMSMSLISLE